MYYVTIIYKTNVSHREENFTCEKYYKTDFLDKGVELLFTDKYGEETVCHIDTSTNTEFKSCIVKNADGEKIDGFKLGRMP